MPEYSDIYVISKKRKSSEIQSFLDNFLQEREESAGEYEVPQYSEKPKITYNNAADILELAETDSSMEYRIYWRSKSALKPEHAMVFYLSDGFTVFGLSTDASDISFVRDLFNRLKIFLDSSIGYIGHEAAPDAGTYEEFMNEIVIHREFMRRQFALYS